MSIHRPLVPALVALALAACAPSATVSRGLPGLSGPVTITRDARGVPHVRAGSELDAFFAQGYVHAQDRLWQMEIQRRAGAGRLAEVLGAPALAQDRFFRTWGFYRAAEASIPALSPETRAALEAYARGVNARIEEGNFPLEYTLVGARPEPWRIADTLVWGKVLAYELGNNWLDEVENAGIVSKIGLAGLNEIKPPYPAGGPSIIRFEDYRGPVDRPGLLPPRPAPRAGTLAALERVAALEGSIARVGFGEATGSNNWVVAGSRTATGKPMLANDPHLRFQAPSLWYLADIQGGDYHSVGATLPGAPGVVIGRNDHLAWGLTNTAPDVMDLFVLEVADGAYATPTGPVPLAVRDETIKVKGAPDEVLRVRESRHGPVISDLGAVGPLPEGQAVAVGWTMLEPGDTTIEAYLKLNRARNWPEFREALRSYVGPMQNFVYADSGGTIAYLAPGRVPRRGWDGRLPASAARGDEWGGSVPFEELPSVVNPREGMIVTANNRVLPGGVTDISTYTDPYRAIRIRERLLERGQHTLESLGDIQGDTLSIPARELVPGLLALAPASDAARRLQDTVRTWDLRFDLGSQGATAFAFYYRELSRLLEDEAGFRYYSRPSFLVPALRGESRFCDDTRTPQREDCASLRARALADGAAALEAALGPVPASWGWGRLHQASFPAVLGAAPFIGPLFNRSIPTPGGFATVNVGAYDQDSFVQTGGPSLRVLFDLADLDNSRAIHPLGQSGDALSGRYADLLEPWRDNKTVPLSARPADWGPPERLELRP